MQLLTLNNIETDEINKKRKMNLTLMILHIDQSFKYEYSSNFDFSSSAFNVAIYVAVFTTPFEWDSSNFSSRKPF